MKIAIEAQRIFREKKHGMDMVVIELIRHLQRIDFENEYFILVKKDKDDAVVKETANFHIIELPAVPYPVWEQYLLPRALKKIAPDIVHCTGNTAPLRIHVPMVLTLHDILYMQKIDLTRGSWYQRMGNLYRRWIVPNIIGRCKKVITVSNFEKNRIDQHFELPQDKVKVIYNSFSRGFEQITDQQKLEDYREKYHLPEKYILYLGNTHPNKNIRNVLKAVSLLRKTYGNATPLVMPDVDQHFLTSILQETGDPELGSFIHLTGYIPNNELVYIYNMASVFLYPSFYESFGIPILESMASGTPVITSQRAGMSEVAGGAALLIDPENAGEIASSIQQLLTDQEQYLEYKIAGLERVRSFSWSGAAARALEVYKEVAFCPAFAYA